MPLDSSRVFVARSIGDRARNLSWRFGNLLPHPETGRGADRAEAALVAWMGGREDLASHLLDQALNVYRRVQASTAARLSRAEVVS